MGEPGRAQDVDLGSPGWGGSVGLSVLVVWRPLVAGRTWLWISWCPRLGPGFGCSKAGFWGSLGHILGSQAGFCGGMRESYVEFWDLAHAVQSPGWVRHPMDTTPRWGPKNYQQLSPQNWEFPKPETS